MSGPMFGPTGHQGSDPRVAPDVAGRDIAITGRKHGKTAAESFRQAGEVALQRMKAETAGAFQAPQEEAPNWPEVLRRYFPPPGHPLVRISARRLREVASHIERLEARVRFLRTEYVHAAGRADTAEARARRLEAELAEARHAIRHLTWSEE